MLGCIDPVLTIAAASSLSRPLFLAPFDKRQEAAAAHAPFRGEMSDQLGLLRAFEGWSAAQRAQGRAAARRYCEQHFLSAHGMEELAGLREQLAASLASLGFASSSLEAQQGAAEGVQGCPNPNLQP